MKFRYHFTINNNNKKQSVKMNLTKLKKSNTLINNIKNKLNLVKINLVRLK